MGTAGLYACFIALKGALTCVRDFPAIPSSAHRPGTVDPLRACHWQALSKMWLLSAIKRALHKKGIHPRRSLTGAITYSRYLGYIRPHLLGVTEPELLVRRKLIAKAWEPRRLAAPMGKRILVLSPHPDDESIGAGGLLIAHRGLAEIHLVCLSDGAGGGGLEGPHTSPTALVEARLAEFEVTATALGAASVQHLDYPSGNIPCDNSAADRLRSIFCSIRPDVVLLPWFLDAHADHRQANRLYASACSEFEATVLGYEIWTMLEPNAVFDITPYLTDKLSLIRNYPSQLRTVDYLAYARGLASVRAFHAAVQPLRSGAAEAFLALPNREYCELVRELAAKTN
jgi:N-acetylglucosamine malate deacetylase 1